MQSSLSIFAQKYLHKCEDTYFILQNKYLGIYEDTFGDDCDQNHDITKTIDIRKQTLVL